MDSTQDRAYIFKEVGFNWTVREVQAFYEEIVKEHEKLITELQNDKKVLGEIIVNYQKFVRENVPTKTITWIDEK